MTPPSRDRRPHVVAAGHRHIPAPKSGTSFPAFLIGGLPDLNPPAAAAAAGQEDTRTAHRPRWRTKRDLLLLSRAAKSSAASKGHKGEFPKAIYKKLADTAASCPWICPTDDGAGRTEDEQDSMLALEKHQHENGWKPEMTKSVRRLDSFLAECADLYQNAVAESKDLPIIQGWKDFCRPGDTEGLIDCDDHVQSTSNDGQVSSSAGKKRPLAQDSSSLPTDPAKRAASLGQYFASDENGAAVVECAIELAKKAFCRNEGASNSTKPPSIVFIEPSCGDGRIFFSLMEHLRLNPVDAACVGCVLGFDIDDRAVEACRTRIRQYRDTAGLPPVRVQQADFLKLTKGGVQQLVADACKGHDLALDGTAVICFGGPPYSLGPLMREDGAGNNESSSQRGLDLPEQFLRRCMIELECCGISFLLPKRSGEDAEALSKHLPRGWNYRNTSLAESSFDFRGKMVIQPSVLQTWEKD